MLDPVSKMVITIAGTGKAGFKDGTALAAQVRNYPSPIYIYVCELNWYRT